MVGEGTKVGVCLAHGAYATSVLGEEDGTNM